MKKLALLMLCALTFTSTYSQRALSEDVFYYDVRMPNNPLEKTIKTYNVIVNIPYTLTVEELNAQSLKAHEEEKANYANILKESEAEYQVLLANHDEEVKQAEARYDKEMKDFKSLSLLERLAMTDQGKNPKLKVPSKPVYVKPSEPIYRKPNINDHLIFDNNVLADGIQLMGYEKGEDIDIEIDITKMKFQDNSGETFYSQPTTVKVIKDGAIIDEKVFDDTFKFLTSSASNTINLERYEKRNVNKIMKEISKYLNQEFGYIPIGSKITILYPKNKKRNYDVLENAKIKAVSAYRKMNKSASLDTRVFAKETLANVREIWKKELSNINYSDKKAIMNKKIAKILFFNMLRVDISLKNKENAEESLALLQEKLIDLDLGYYDKETLTKLEEQVYKLQ